MFVVSECVGAANLRDLDSPHPQARVMDWTALRELQSAGWEIGGHTCTHPRLPALDAAQALDEIRRNKEQIDEALQTTPRTFCYPYGDFNETVVECVRKAGYIAACTTRSGPASARDNPLLLPRVKVYHEGILDLLYRVLVRPHMPTFRRYPSALSHR